MTAAKRTANPAKTTEPSSSHDRISVELPKRRLTVLTEVSGSGKSSLLPGAMPTGAGVVFVDQGGICQWVRGGAAVVLRSGLAGMNGLRAWRPV